MTSLARLDDHTARTVDPTDRDFDLALVRDWPQFAHRAARAYETLNGSGTPIPSVLAASAVALSKLSIPRSETQSPLRAATDALTGRTEGDPDAARRLDTQIAESIHTTFRAAQRSLPGPAADWLNHTEQVVLTTNGQPRSTLTTALGHWSLALARIDTNHPVVLIGIAATQRRLAATTRNTIERAVTDGTFDRADAEPLHRAVSHAYTAWSWYQTTLNKTFDPRQPLPAHVLAQVSIVQEPALAFRDALTIDQPLTDRLALFTTHDLGAATLAARIVNDPLIDAATRETRIQTMATGRLQLRSVGNHVEPAPIEPAQTTRPSFTAAPGTRVADAPDVDPTRLLELTPDGERDYSVRRDRGLAIQKRLDQGLVTPADRSAAEAAIADGKRTVAELVTYGARVINAALVRVRQQPTYANRRDVTQQAWLLATEAATSFDPDKGRWTSYLKQYLDATLRPTTARMDTSGTVLPEVKVRVADPVRAAALAKLYGDRLRPVIAGDFAHFNERDPAQEPADQQALTRLDNQTLDHLVDKVFRHLDALPPLRRDAVTATYLTPEPLSDVAKRHHVSTQTVRREARRGLHDLATGISQPDRPATLDRRLQRRGELERRAPSVAPRPATGITR